MDDEIEEKFKNSVIITRSTNRSGCGTSIECKKGLWAVHAPTYSKAMREARHYFIQYYEDGEYD